MTFALVVANADQIVQVSDRRLTGWDHSVLTEAFGKAGHLLCDDASVLYCFAGLATIGRRLNTSNWLREVLQEAGKRDARFRELIEHFAELATAHFRNDQNVLSAPTEHRRLTVMLSGYTDHGHITSALVSNFQDFARFINYAEAQSQFTVHCELSKMPATENPTLIQAIGAFSAMTESDKEGLRQLLERRSPHDAIRAKAAAIVADISNRHRSAGTVGKRLNVARIDYRSPLVAYAGYDSDIVEQEMPMLDMVDARTVGTGLLIGQVQISADAPIVYPVVHRNAPCPCGSGKKFRLCHRLNRQ